MGEHPERVFNFGMSGLDNIYKLDLLSQKKLESSLDFKLDHKTALVTYHPVTLGDNSIEEDINNLLLALDHFKLNIIFTKSNADTGGRIINQRIAEYVEMNSDKSIFVDNLGQLRYLSALKYVDLMIGNSSSGITEAPSFKLPVVNIGDRQKGRVKADNIIDTNNSFSELTKSMKKALSTEFKQQLSNLINPYDKYKDGKTSEKIKDKLKRIPLNNNILKKEFKDIDF
jgi:UDP-hydrolysing UDP-N-acetyl-D-glucosamine 2-epimerase